MQTFPCHGPVTTAVHVPAGTVEIHATDRDDAEVDVQPGDDSRASRDAAENTQVSMDGGELTVRLDPGRGGWLSRLGRVRVTVRVPAGGTVHIRTASADVRCHGRYGTADVRSASGAIYLEDVDGDVSVKSASGRILVDSAGGAVHADSASGDVTLGRAGGEVSVKTASGHVNVDDAATSVQARTASGAVRVGVARAGTVRITCASGGISVGIAPGTGVWMDLNTLSGRAYSDLPVSGDQAAQGGGTPAATLRLDLRTLSGNVRVHRATPGAGAGAPQDDRT